MAAAAVGASSVAVAAVDVTVSVTLQSRLVAEEDILGSCHENFRYCAAAPVTYCPKLPRCGSTSAGCMIEVSSAAGSAWPYEGAAPGRGLKRMLQWKSRKN